MLSQVETHIFLVAVLGAGRPVTFDEHLIVLDKGIPCRCFPYKLDSVGIRFVGLMLPGYGKEILAGEQLPYLISIPIQQPDVIIREL